MIPVLKQGSEKTFDENMADEAYLLLLAKDYAGAWLFLKKAGNIADSVFSLYNTSLCLLQINECEEALTKLHTAERIISAPFDKQTINDEKFKKLLSDCNLLAEPFKPISRNTEKEIPSYVNLRVKLLIIICCIKCGRSEEAGKYAEMLDAKYPFLYIKEFVNSSLKTEE